MPRCPTHTGNLGLRHADEVTHLDDLDEPAVDFLERLQGLVDAQHLLVVGPQIFCELRIELDALQLAAAALGLPLASEIDHDRAHDPAGIREEMPAVADVQPPGLLKPEEALVHQHGGIEERVATASTQQRARVCPQLLVRNCKQALTRGFIASVGLLQ